MCQGESPKKSQFYAGEKADSSAAFASLRLFVAEFLGCTLQAPSSAQTAGFPAPLPVWGCSEVWAYSAFRGHDPENPKAVFPRGCGYGSHLFRDGARGDVCRSDFPHLGTFPHTLFVFVSNVFVLLAPPPLNAAFFQCFSCPARCWHATNMARPPEILLQTELVDGLMLVDLENFPDVLTMGTVLLGRVLQMCSRIRDHSFHDA